MTGTLLLLLGGALLFGGGCGPGQARQNTQPPSPPTIPTPRIIRRTDAAPVGARGGTLRYATFAEPKSFNPVMAVESSSTDVTYRLFSALLSLNYRTRELEGDLAESWGWTPDPSGARRSITFTLREGLKWSDGHPLTADDVIFTFQVVYDPAIASPRRDMALINGEAVTVEKQDDRTVRFILPERCGAAPFSLGAAVSIIPKHKLEAAYRAGTFPSAYSLKTPPGELVGSGPFRLREYKGGERVVMERNPYYHGIDANGEPLPYLDRLIFITVPDQNVQLLKFLSGETDVFPMYGPRFHEDLVRGRKVGDYRLLDLGVMPVANFLFFNMNPAKLDPVKRKWFSNRKFRQAVSHAIDRGAMIRLVYMGMAAEYGLFHPDSPWHAPDLGRFPHDPEKARRLLLEAGFEYRGDRLHDTEGNRVSFSLMTNAGNNDRVATAIIIKEDLTRLGMDVTFTPIDFNKLISKLNSTFDWEACVLAANGYVSTIEPAFAKHIWMSSGSFHLWYPQQKTPATPWEAELDRLTADGARAESLRERKRIYRRVQEILAEEVPLIFTVTRSDLYAVSNRIGNADVRVSSGLISYSFDTDLLSMLYLKNRR